MRKPLLLIANWKMNLNAAASLELAQQIIAGAPSPTECEIWLAPSFTALATLSRSSAKGKFKLGAQNAHWSDKGAFTGEISVSMLAEHGVSFVIAGHSERRHIFHEDDHMCVERACAVLKGGMTVVFCVGETLAERDQGQTLSVLERQLNALLEKLDSNSAAQVVLAYEPVWAIGTGNVAQTEDINTAHLRLSTIWNAKFPSVSAPIIYGGSVNGQNFESISALESVDGALVGGASLDSKQFLKLAEIGGASRK